MEENGKLVSGESSDRPWQSYHTVFTNAKAGMEGVDKEKVQRIVYEMSKGSKFFENEERKEALMKQKIENMLSQRVKLTDADISHYQKIADRKVVELEGTRDLSRIWLHVDMDAFYAAVETLCNPSLKGKPMAVGGLSMISTANYEARRFGVRAAMPGFIARKLCPQLIFVPVDFKKYTHYSDLTRKVFRKYDANFIAGSLDEAYLDITNVCNERGMTGAQVADELRGSVHEETGLTCSAGVGPNRLLAKVCSDINKPNGQFVLPNERTAVMTFISSLPIRKIGGIGKVTENVLKDVFGITTCEDMLQKSSFICALFSPTSADFFLSVALGIGGTDAPQETLRKSMSNERTFSSTEDDAFLHQKLMDLAENLSSDMEKEGLSGRTLTLKLKTSAFEVRTRAVTLQSYICSSEDILKHATKLLKAELPVSLRLMGLRMSHFREGGKGFVDPKQRTLNNFIITEDASRKRLGVQSLEGSINDEDTLSGDQERNFPNDPKWSHERFDLMDAHQISDLDPVVSESGGETELVERDSSTMQFNERSLDPQKQVNSCTEDEPRSPYSNIQEPVFWLDDYRCSICGIELPTSFEEERQEHFDFHFAERLQKEESESVQRIPPRFINHNAPMYQVQKRKKLKASPSSEGSHQVQAVPYDYSFTHECLAKPLGPQYGGGIVVNPEFDNGLMAWTNFGDANINHQQSQDGNKFIVASNRTQHFHSVTQKFYLEKDKLYTFSAWLQVSKGDDDHIAAVFKTQHSYETAGWVIARNGCWSMLKGGLVVNASGPAHLYFESNNINVDIWADSISLQPFTHEEWKSHQDQSIEKFRKGKVKLQALDKNGQPIANASVSLNQTNGYYKLGCAINQNILQNRAYQNWFLSRFRITVFENELKWYSTEKSRGREDYSVADAMMQFARSHGLSIRGHNVFWDDPKYQPSWVPGLSSNDLSAAAFKRINSVMKRYAGQLFHWDVVNENLHFSFFEGKLGSRISTTFYQNANRIDPRTTPFLNEYNTIEDPRDGASSPARYLQKINQIRQEGYKGPLGIGLEGHFKYANIPYIRSTIDTLARYRLPIWVTELDVSAGPNQASYLNQILGELRAHPAVNGIMIWSAWSPRGCYAMCLTDNNFNNLATGNVVDKFRRQLSEGAEGVTDSNGFFETSLYHGEYEAKISHPDAVESSKIKKFDVNEGTEGMLHFSVQV